MLACGAIKQVDSHTAGFFSPIFTVDKMDRGKVYGKRVIISEYFFFPISYLAYLAQTLTLASARQFD